MRVYSLNTTFNNDAEGKEILDVMGSNENKSWQLVAGSSEEVDPEDQFFNKINVTFNEVDSLIDIAYNLLPYNVFFKFILWLLLFFRKPKSRNAQTAFKNYFMSNQEEDAFELILLEIRNKIAQHLT